MTFLKRIIRIKLPLQIFIAIILAVILGFIFHQHPHCVDWLSTIFLRALKMLIIPLVFSSIGSSVVNIGSGPGKLGRLGLKTMVYYISTSLLAIITGLFLVNLIQPGIGVDLNLKQSVPELESVAMSTSFLEIIVNIVPANIFQTMSEGHILSVIFFTILFGLFIRKVDDKYSALYRDLLNGLFEIMMKLTLFVIRFAPLGVFAIVFKMVATHAQDPEGLLNLFGRLGLFMLTVLIGLTIHFFISIPSLIKFVGKLSPYRHFRAVAAPLLTAFSTSSSGATLPLTMQAVEENDGVSKELANFTLPLGATVNMDGTALHECVAALFIAQAYGIELSIGQQIIVVCTALLGSIGAAGIPMAGLVMISVILSVVGLPLEGVGLIIAVDQLLEMCRTATNVWSDTSAAIIIAKTEGEKLLIE